jgi:hypothetical protein
MCFIFSDLKCYLSAISGSRNHLWSAKEKEWWKNNKEKKSFSTYKTCFFFFFFSLNPSYFQTSELSYFLFIFDNLKTNIQGIYWVFWELTLIVFSGWLFEFLTLFTLWGCNFFISYLFLTIVSVSDVPRGGFKFCLDIRNNWALPLDPACPECLSFPLPAGLP